MRSQGQQPVPNAVIKRGLNIWDDPYIISNDPVELNGRIKKAGEEPNGVYLVRMVYGVKPKDQFVVDIFCGNISQRRPALKRKTSIRTFKR
jgi:hypothetical protein